MKHLDIFLKYRDIVYLVFVIILTVFLMNKCSAYKSAQNEISRQQNNIAAMTDSLNYFIDAYGRVNGEMHAYQLTQKELEDSIGKIDKRHREYVSYLKTKLSATDTLYVNTYIDRIVKDSMYLDNGTIQIDSTDIFGNSKREIAIKIPFYVDSLLQTGTAEIDISQDIFVEGWLERDTKTGETYIRLRSDYPGLKFNSAMGVVASNSKEYEIQMRKRNGVGVFVGPSVGIGYDPISRSLCPNIGINVGFGYTFAPKRLQWGK